MPLFLVWYPWSVRGATRVRYAARPAAQGRVHP